MTGDHWFEEIKHQFDRRGLSLLLKNATGGGWIATAWKQRPLVHDDGDLPVSLAEGATPREAALRLLLILDDGEAPAP